MAVVVFAVMWPLSLVGHAVGLTPSWHQLMNRNHVWEHRHYPLVGLRYVGVVGIVLSAGALLLTPFILRGRRVERSSRQAAAAQAEEQRRAAEMRNIERVRLAEAETAAREQRAADEARKAQERRAAWLAGPPPLLPLPGRFTQNWIAEHVPELHPGQLPVLFEELKRRGWSPQDIRRRVLPYLPADLESSQRDEIGSLIWTEAS